MDRKYKYLILFSLVLITTIFFNILTYGQELNFKILESRNDWEAAKFEAKKAGKDIFLDIYASWCGPCKMMDADVYTSADVIEYFNFNFINLKVDGESEFGSALASQYKVSAYPSMYFINSDEVSINLLVGYRDAEALVNAGKVVKEYGTRYLELNKLYNTALLTDLQTEELMKLFAKFEKKDELAVLAESRLKTFTEADILNPSNKSIVLAAPGDIESLPVKTVLGNAKSLKELWGQEEFNQYLSNSFDKSMQNATESVDSIKMELIAEVLIPVYMMDNPDRIPEAKLTTRKIYYSQIEDWDEYIQSVEKHYNDFENGNLRFLYLESYYIIENQLYNTRLLNKSMEWLEKVIAINPGFDTYFLAAIINTYREDKGASVLWMNKAESVAVTDDEKASLEELKKYLEGL